MIKKLFQPFLGNLLSLLPAFFYGCSYADATHLPPQPSATGITKVSMAPSHGKVSTLDIFVFKDDLFQKLDSYQRVDVPEGPDMTVMSGSGDRIITAVANLPGGRENWFRLNSRAFLYGTGIRLEDESFDCPCMCGEISVKAGEEVPDKIQLRPFVSEICLSSIRCDFKGKAYEGEKITDARVYLINVNAGYTVLEDGDSGPVRFINAGKFCEEDVMSFAEPELVVNEIAEDIGAEKLRPDIRLWCYPNNNPEETVGTPYTRLVIEGKVAGQTFYWPVNINREGGEKTGIWRNMRYSFDIKITRKGSLSPDIPVNTNEISINHTVTEWKEKEEYEVEF